MVSLFIILSRSCWALVCSHYGTELLSSEHFPMVIGSITAVIYIQF